VALEWPQAIIIIIIQIYRVKSQSAVVDELQTHNGQECFARSQAGPNRRIRHVFQYKLCALLYVLDHGLSIYL